MEMKIKGTDLEKTQKTESKNGVSESRTEMVYQEHKEYKKYRAKINGKNTGKWGNCACSRYGQGPNHGINAFRFTN